MYKINLLRTIGGGGIKKFKSNSISWIFQGMS